MSTQPIDIITLFKEAAFEADGRTLDALTLDSKFSELSMDSVAVMETIGVCEQRLSVRFNDEDLGKLTTLRDLDTLVAKLVRAA
jgi:acyl carrier protein